METMTKEREIGQPQEKMVLLYEDKATTRNVKEMARRNCNDLTKLLTALNSLNLKIHFSIDDLFGFITRGQSHIDKSIRSRIVESEDLTTTSGLTFNRQAVESMVQLPDLSEVFQLADSLKRQTSAVSKYDGLFSANMFVISGDTVSLDNKNFESLLDKSRTFLPESDWALLSQAVENIDQLLSKYGGSPNRGEIQKSMILFDRNNRSCSVNEKFFKNI